MECQTKYQSTLEYTSNTHDVIIVKARWNVSLYFDTLAVLHGHIFSVPLLSILLNFVITLRYSTYQITTVRTVQMHVLRKFETSLHQYTKYKVSTTNIILCLYYVGLHVYV